MNILIVENEKPAADRLIRILNKIDKSILITGVIDTVEDTINKLQEDRQPDLILMDIQLDDGLCFEIFETINIDIPIIFTTAYDEFTLKAFKVNSIDYLLKPIEEELLKSALSKYKKLYSEKDRFKRDFRNTLSELRDQYKSRFLIKTGNRYRSVPTREVNHFHITGRSVFLCENNGKDSGIDYSLEQLQGTLDPHKFFRINRECIVNIEAISLMHSYSSSRLQLSLKNNEKSEMFVVSRDKVR